MARRTSRRPYPYRCPLCQQAMIGEKSDPALEDDDRYRCLNCGTVVEFGGKRKEPELERKG